MRKPPYELQGLLEGVARRKQQIEILRAAIKKERETIAEYEGWIKQHREYKKWLRSQAGRRDNGDQNNN